jgi:hypothetical protein
MNGSPGTAGKRIVNEIAALSSDDLDRMIAAADAKRKAERTTGVVTCDDCSKRHIAEYDHNGRKEWDDGDTRYFAVVCDVDGLTGYYAESRVEF